MEYNENSDVYVSSCNDGQNQKWNLFYNNISPKYDDKKCLSSENNKIFVRPCDNEQDNQVFNIDTDEKTVDDFNWADVKGKSVVLVESDNPWYVNKDTTTMINYKQGLELNNNLAYRENADYKSNFIMDNTKRDLGYGHSYSDRLGTCCNKKIEGFGCRNNNQTIIIGIILLIIILLLIFRYCKKNNI
jgi:hypothetical protein